MSGVERFSEFMQRALYDPQRGYYTARIKTVGARGDFSTTATLSKRLGQAIAAWLLSESKATGVRTIIEIGGGSGALMRTVLDALGWWQRRRFRVLMVESSPVLTAQQKQTVGNQVASWFGTLPEALAACEGQALIYHNELMDAFPVDLAQWDGASWREVGLCEGGREELRSFEWSEEDKRAHAMLGSQPAQPQRAELHTALRSWFQQWLPMWQKGSMLAIDYGDVLPGLYHRRPRGTLRGYLLQQRVEGPEVYANPGRQDITCDVNFTDVRTWLAALGTVELGYESQRSFMERLAPTASSSTADAFVLDGAGAGWAFQCLAVRRA